MDPQSAILLKTFSNVADADVAASRLRSGGIECVVKSDDCGGMYPQMGVIQLLVDPALADDARRILGASPAAMTSEPDQELRSLAAPTSSPPKVFRFNSGLIVGVIVGALLHVSYTRLWQLRDITTRRDQDRDGFPEAEEIWKQGHLTEVRFDRNGDGRFDYWSYYRGDVSQQDESDDNFDTKVDGSYTFSKRSLFASGQFDTDFNGIPDALTTYENGIVKQTDWRPNGTNVIMLRQLFRRGVLAQELRDLNGDGRFDISIDFDAFLTPLRTNTLSSEDR